VTAGKGPLAWRQGCVLFPARLPFNICLGPYRVNLER
jgi:hypothetical protein